MLNIPLARALGLFMSLSLAATVARAEDNMIVNGDFEKGADQWQLLLGKDAENSGATLSVTNLSAHSGLQSLKLASPVTARFSAGPNLKAGGKVTPGERYHLSLWVCAGDDFVQKPGSIGFVVRVNLRQADRSDSPSGQYYFAPPARGMLAGYGVPRSQLGTTPLPREWTRLSVVFDIPDGVTYVGFNFFAESGSGTVLIDDVSMVKVDAATPVTPLLPTKR